ncbi:MAG: aldehyde dehydrogenase [Deltaproteobacteria bacterium]|nr:aldehyde dehydrogenase [Deltaproteobacteria bacterium]
MKELLNYVDGRLVPAAAFLDNVDPAVGAAYSRVPDSAAEDVDRAVDAAARASREWAERPAAERARVLRAIAARIQARLEDFARAESIDSGKTVAAARALDIPRAVANFEFFADAATQFASESHASAGAVNYTLRTPVPIAGCIAPWNLPLYLFTWKIAPALAAGCAVVAKPSEVTPMTAFMLSEVCIEAGLPAGVLNIIHGLGPKVGARIVAHPSVAAVSFTGSTKVGAEIARTAGPMFKKLSLELGGKNPTIVFSDADFEAALDGTIRAAFSNQGQICLCGSRVFVERAIYDRFKAALIERTRSLRVGDPLTDVDQGAVVSRAHFDKVMGCIETAQAEGGRLLAGGKRVVVDGRCRDGWFIAPTLFEGLAPASRTQQEEIFGPVATLTPFDREEEVVGWANGTSYGLAASLWTRDLSRAHRVAAAVQSGIVWVNCWLLRDLRTPFGGMKGSGVGREGGFEAMRFFTEAKNVCVKL